jgi:multiple sugar transport system permease protein
MSYKFFKKPISKVGQAYCFVAPALLILLILLVYPLFQVIKLSFFDVETSSSTFIGLNNYSQLMTDPIFYKALGHTLYFTIGSVLFHFIIGLGLALMLNQPINRVIRSLFRGILIIPWLIAPTVAAMIWVLIYNPFGLLNGLLTTFGLIKTGGNINWLGDPAYALFSTAVVNIWRGVPFIMVMLLAGLQGIPEELYEAGMLDGATAWKAFVYITLPSLKGTFMTVGLLDTIWTFRHFDTIFTMTGGGPVNSSEVLTTYIYNLAFRSMRWGYASAEAVIMFLILLIFSLLYIQRVRKEEV